MRRHEAGSVHRRRIDIGVVDAIEHVGESDESDSKADLDELLVGVAGSLDRCKLLVADFATGLYQRADEAHQRIALRIACGPALADVADRIRPQPC